MIKRILLLSYVITIFALPKPWASAQARQECSSCSVVERALKDLQSLKVGMARKDIAAHNFVMSGGMLFRDRTAYIYQDCEYIKLEIEFTLDPAVDQAFSDKDTIKGVSKLALDYPVKD